MTNFVTTYDPHDETLWVWPMGGGLDVAVVAALRVDVRGLEVTFEQKVVPLDLLKFVTTLVEAWESGLELHAMATHESSDDGLEKILEFLVTWSNDIKDSIRISVVDSGGMDHICDVNINGVTYMTQDLPIAWAPRVFYFLHEVAHQVEDGSQGLADFLSYDYDRMEKF